MAQPAKVTAPALASNRVGAGRRSPDEETRSRQRPSAARHLRRVSAGETLPEECRNCGRF